MANLSRQNLKNRFRFVIEIRPYLRDHYFEGKAVFPAVEAMIILAQAAKISYPQATLQTLTQALFPRILALDPTGDRLEAQVQMESSESGITASLLTSLKTKSGTMSRIVEHARVTFAQNEVLPEPSLSCRDVRRLANECINIPAASIYRELIPFGVSYRNVIGDLSVSSEGALADISGGSGEADDQLLGSPFALDAAMHAACVWGQRFADIVAFPVGFDRRIIYNATKKGASYLARIVPVDVSRELLIFDAWIYDQHGIICESISGLRMRDISRGRMRPPQWIKEGAWKK